MRATLRTRTTLLATALTAVTLVAASVTLVLTLDDRLTVGGDAAAQARVADLLAIAGQGSLPEEVPLTDDEGVVQVVDADGRVVAASANVAGRPAIADVAAGPDPQVLTLDAPDDDETETYRVWVAEGPTPDGPVTVYVGTSLESVDEATSTARRALLVGVPLVLLLLAGALWWVLGRALRRVDDLRAEVDTITADRLDRRVPEQGVDDEIGRLALTMNRMLARLEAGRERQRAFVADASHDLQGPLATQRAVLEVALTEHDDSAAPDPVLRDLLATTGDLESLVADLLVLAAADDGLPVPPPEALDLDDLVLEEALRARAGSGTVLDTAGVSAAPAYAARSEVVRIVRNLVDNAAAHAASTVRLTTRVVDGAAELAVADDGPGVPPGEEEAVFERFHRGDRARSRGTGSGLGLAIARGLAERNGGTLVLDPGAPGARFVLTLPGVVGPTP